PTIERLKGNLALFTQDSWTRKRLTLNLGLRFETLNGYVPEQHLAAGRFIGARDFAPVYDTPNWKDLSPRMGAVYDLFGTGRTASAARGRIWASGAPASLRAIATTSEKGSTCGRTTGKARSVSSTSCSPVWGWASPTSDGGTATSGSTITSW